jgi:hypothetical protein
MALRDDLPWILSALVVVLGVIAYLWWSRPPDHVLPEIYGVM